MGKHKDLIFRNYFEICNKTRDPSEVRKEHREGRRKKKC
jgi:hypothetical protein